LEKYMDASPKGFRKYLGSWTRGSTVASPDYKLAHNRNLFLHMVNLLFPEIRRQLGQRFVEPNASASRNGGQPIAVSEDDALRTFLATWRLDWPWVVTAAKHSIGLSAVRASKELSDPIFDVWLVLPREGHSPELMGSWDPMPLGFPWNPVLDSEQEFCEAMKGHIERTKQRAFALGLVPRDTSRGRRAKVDRMLRFRMLALHVLKDRSYGEIAEAVKVKGRQPAVSTVSWAVVTAAAETQIPLPSKRGRSKRSE
jgi:hypothetical protein